jgi:hypothetical protein
VQDATVHCLEHGIPVEGDSFMAVVRLTALNERARRREAQETHSQAQALRGEEDTSFGEYYEDEEETPVRVVKLREAVRRSPARDRQVIEAIYWRGLSLTKVAQERHVSRQAMQSIHRRILCGLRVDMAVAGTPPNPTRYFKAEPPVRGWVRGGTGGWGAATWVCGVCRLTHVVQTKRCLCSIFEEEK